MVKKEEILFLEEYSKLNGRARNFLHFLHLDSYTSFYAKIIKERKTFDFQSIQNCGSKTVEEIEKFIRKIISITGVENKFKYSNDISENWILQLKFKNLVHGCPPATKKFLKSNGVTNLQEFNDTFIQGIQSYFSKTKIRIPPFTKEYLDSIKIKLLYASQKLNNIKESINLFALLQFLLFEDCFTREVERSILKNYLLFNKGGQYMTFQQIGDNFNISASRISQIADQIISVIDRTLDQIKSEQKNNWPDYIQDDVFMANTSWEEKINRKENTTLSYKFMAYALRRLYEGMPYIFIEILALGKFNDILFIRYDLNFDFQGFFEDVNYFFGYPDPMKCIFPFNGLTKYCNLSNDVTLNGRLIERIQNVGKHLSLEIEFNTEQSSLIVKKT